MNAKEIDQKRQSYNRGQFQQNDPNKLLCDFPPQLSESSISKHRQSLNTSQAHSDDEIEVRRGLESENARTDMGSNPELLRQSTHSLLLRPEQAKDNEEKFGGGESMLAD